MGESSLREVCRCRKTKRGHSFGGKESLILFHSLKGIGQKRITQTQQNENERKI